ncbi:glycosyltransferase family 2 protein [Ruegeria sp. HKCCC2111]|uniref:glycosyltransferase family 2 protein n=1 Tax=unclassified Ruegeria TaxID=2625375 RepID=UPI0035304E3C
MFSRQVSLSQITIISVCFNSSGVLPEMLNSIPDGVPTILVDNASDDVEAVQELAETHGAILLRNKENKGFGSACNLGAERAQTDLLLFLNPDSKLLPGALEAMQAGADRYPSASAFNPRILSKSGKPSFRRSSVITPRSETLRSKKAEGDLELPVLLGAALLVRRSAFEAVGGFDPEIFLYHEDDDLSLRLKAVCGPLYYIHDAQVTHVQGTSSPSSAAVAGLKGVFMGQSRVYAARKHKVPFAFTRALSSAFLQMLSPVVLFSARKRSKQRAFLRGVWQSRNVHPAPFKSPPV